MSSSSCTPAPEGAPARPSAVDGLTARARALLPWGLVATWAGLVLFGIVALVNPPWLQALSKPGIQTEARSYVNWGDKRARDGDFGHALQWYQRALALDPTFTRAAVNSAIALGRLDRPQEGVEILEGVLAAGQGIRPLVLYNLGELHLRQGAHEQAIARYQEALTTGGWPQLVGSRLGDIHMRRGEHGQARAALLEAARRWEDPATHYRNMLVAALDAGPEDGDSEQWRSAVQATLQRGVGEADLARYDLDFLRRQLGRDPELARILGRLAAVEARMGRRSDAIEHLERSLEIWPDNPSADSYRSALSRLRGAGLPPRGP